MRFGRITIVEPLVLVSVVGILAALFVSPCGQYAAAD